MKKKVIMYLFILFIFVFLILTKIHPYRVHRNVYLDIKKCHVLLIQDVDNLKKNKVEKDELSKGTDEFSLNFRTKKTTKKEKELFSALLDEAYYYERMKAAKEKGDEDIFNEVFSKFEKKIIILEKYFSNKYTFYYFKQL